VDKRIPAISIETQEVIRRLLKCEQPGDFVSYGELSQCAMGNVQHEKRFAINTARDRLLSEKNWVFEAVVNEGLRRLTDPEIIRTGEVTVSRIHRASRRGLKKLLCVNPDKLSPADLMIWNAKVSVCGFLDHVTKANQIKRIEGKVASLGVRLQLEETFSALERKDVDEKILPKLKIVSK